MQFPEKIEDNSSGQNGILLAHVYDNISETLLSVGNSS